MNNDASFQRLAAVTSILATLLALGSIGFQASNLLTIPSEVWPVEQWVIRW